MVNLKSNDVSCSYIACDRYDLNKHMTTDHDVPQPYTCYACGLEFYTKRGIIKHLSKAIPCEWAKCKCADNLKQ